MIATANTRIKPTFLQSQFVGQEGVGPFEKMEKCNEKYKMDMRMDRLYNQMIGMNGDSKIRKLGKIFEQAPQDENKKKVDSELSLRELKIEKCGFLKVTMLLSM